MRLPPLLLRLLLTLALIANGVTGAFAATQMQTAHVAEITAQAKATTLAHTKSAEPACHEHRASMGDAQTDLQIAPADVPKTGSDTEHGAPDCCKSAKCACACMQHLASTSASVHMLQVRIDHASGVRPLTLGHATPALPHLIRPPIG